MTETKFINCPKCDFEWHITDGEICPVCNSRKKFSYPFDEGEPRFGGIFGTGNKTVRINRYYVAIGLIALVGFITTLFSAW